MGEWKLGNLQKALDLYQKALDIEAKSLRGPPPQRLGPVGMQPVTRAEERHQWRAPAYGGRAYPVRQARGPAPTLCRPPRLEGDVRPGGGPGAYG